MGTLAVGLKPLVPLHILIPFGGGRFPVPGVGTLVTGKFWSFTSDLGGIRRLNWEYKQK
jgi:hypothetical protein